MRNKRQDLGGKKALFLLVQTTTIFFRYFYLFIFSLAFSSLIKLEIIASFSPGMTVCRSLDYYTLYNILYIHIYCKLFENLKVLSFL